MVRREQKATRSGETASRQPEAFSLKERLRQLSVNDLAEIVEKFLAQLDERQRRAFVKLLPAVHPKDPQSQPPYDSDQDFLYAVKNFCERVRNEAFVEYGASYDPEERAYHAFGDDSWIDEMNALFYTAELYFLAQHYETAAEAYRLLFDCLLIDYNGGGYHFTTSDPQGALSVDLVLTRKQYFESLCHTYTGEALAERIVHGLEEYRPIGEKPPDLKELFPEGGEIIQLVEKALLASPLRYDPYKVPVELNRPAELLRQIYRYFRSLEDLERFVRQYGEKHPWSYEELVRGYAEKDDWGKVSFWASQGLTGKAGEWGKRNATLADYKARAAQQLGDPSAALSALWEAFDQQADVEHYVALRKAARVLGLWRDYYPRLVKRLTHNVSGDAGRVDHVCDNRLLVEVLLVEGEYERALKRAEQSSFLSWNEKEDARKSAVDFLLHSVTRGMDKDALANQYPEIARRLDAPTEFVKQLKGELFQGSLSEAERDRQIDWIIGVVKWRIDQMVRDYVHAARDAKLVDELYRLQGRSDKAQSFIAGLHKQYWRLRNFRAELRKLGLGSS